jgi:lipopolysaccharide transport system ATP-binding protein
MNDIAIQVNNLSKCYQIYDNPRDRLKQFVAPRLQRLTRQPSKQYFREFWALKVAWAGYAWFQKTRKGFADVL